MLEPVPDKRSSINEIKTLLNEVWDTEENEMNTNKENSRMQKL